jgi:hypothetical protein
MNANQTDTFLWMLRSRPHASDNPDIAVIKLDPSDPDERLCLIHPDGTYQLILRLGEIHRKPPKL